MVRIFVITAVVVLSLASCSILLPYHENKLCERGATHGVCGRVSAVYEDTVQNPCKYKDIPSCDKKDKKNALSKEDKDEETSSDTHGNDTL